MDKIAVVFFKTENSLIGKALRINSWFIRFGEMVFMEMKRVSWRPFSLVLALKIEH